MICMKKRTHFLIEPKRDPETIGNSAARHLEARG